MTQSSTREARRADHPLAALRRVVIGSENPPKLAGARAALEAYAPRVEVRGVAVESGVSEQPVGFAEIHRGARNRARAAFALRAAVDSGTDGAAGRGATARSGAPCTLAIGIEDGLVVLDELEGACLNIGVAVICDGVDAAARESFGLSSGFAYPPACVGPALAERTPIGGLFDALWRETHAPPTMPAAPSALSEGNVGKLSLGVLPRSEYARHAVLCALVRWLHPELYPAPEADSALQRSRAAAPEATA